MQSAASLEVRGHLGRIIANIRYAQPDRPDAPRAIVLPGLGYTCQAPLLYYLALLLHETGHDVLAVDFGYRETPEYLAAPAEARDAWGRDDALAVLNAVRETTEEPLVLAGKSLGTRAMAALHRDRLLPTDTRLVWLTPALTSEELRTLADTLTRKSLFLIGTADGWYDRGACEALAANPHVTLVLFAGADHSLERGSEVEVAILNLTRSLDAVRVFLGDGNPGSR